ncbi:MAG TPA: sigma-70 family RNA polymerase sigma factor [Chryseosolibacter sp.]|nr:sigma-70 family RNA polymerase sigma factor [Chryseosolibacter sp.]
MQTTAPGISKGLYHELIRFVQKRVGNKSTAEDIVQDVFIKVHSKSAQLRDEDKISAWIFQIARNAVSDHFRKSSRSVQPVDIDWDSGVHEFNDCVAYCLKAMMLTLPDKYRIPLELTEIDNLSQYEVANRLKISYPGARSRVQRARKMLKAKIDELYLIKTDVYGNVIVCENRFDCCCKPGC